VPVSVVSFALPPSTSLLQTDTLIRAIGKRARTFHSIVFFSFNCVLGSTLGYASQPEFTCPKGSSNDTHSSMVLFKTSPVIPTNVTWLAMLLLIGILGMISQVRSPLSPSSVVDPAREDAFGHGFTTGDRFSWCSCCLYLSMFFAPRLFCNISTILGCLCYHV
jgi:hypothetical protein